MRLKSLSFAAAGLLSIALPAAASADPYWVHDDWRRHEWREHEWREHEWRDHHPWADGGYGPPRCFVEDRGYYDWYGRYVYRPVRICYR
jgi:hypothetical protein